MKRRAFLGFLGGAAAAGPKLATDIASTLNIPAPPIGGGWVGGGLNAAPANGDWKLTRIAQIKDILSGKDPQAANNRKMQRMYQAEQVERFRLDGLRSVSANHKMQMLLEGNNARQDRINRLHLERELDELLAVKLPF